jgi:hypothetical protein
MALRKLLVAAELERARLAECTFSPDTSLSSSSARRGPQRPATAPSAPSSPSSYLERNKARAREASAQRQALEWAECTFAPRTNVDGGGAGARPRRPCNPPPRPAGWDKFFERRRAAAALRREAEERAARVFGGGSSGSGSSSDGGRRGSFTVAAGVGLETDRRAVERRRVAGR